jgi:hypothetical protein
MREVHPVVHDAAEDGVEGASLAGLVVVDAGAQFGQFRAVLSPLPLQLLPCQTSRPAGDSPRLGCYRFRGGGHRGAAHLGRETGRKLKQNISVATRATKSEKLVARRQS